MRLVELGGEQQFSEGEPDLEPPEELAVGEIDDDAILEAGLDTEAVSEEDVDDELLSWTLEDLVHVGDDGEPVDGVGGVEGAGAEDDDEELAETLEVEDLEDLEESLDLLLALRLSGAGALEGGAEEDGPGGEGESRAQGGVRLGCRPEEFVCRRCFLVHHRSQLEAGTALVCRDCAG
jgi:hypothetical protein